MVPKGDGGGGGGGAAYGGGSGFEEAGGLLEPFLARLVVGHYDDGIGSAIEVGPGVGALPWAWGGGGIAARGVVGS